MRLPLLLLLIASPLAAEPPRLALPVDCTPGETCHIQSYVDIDPTDGALDHACGTLSYDTHKGTDFALPDLAAMVAGVNVVAAAAGRVRAVRDGMPDVLYTEAEDLGGQDCGNGVVIAHPDGWETQYCHLQQGSVTVREGQAVEAGTLLGRIGLSGRTQFPHLHLSVRHEGRAIDPFAPDAAPGQCGAPGESLFETPLPYRPGGLIAAGFAEAVPDYAAIKAGTAAAPALGAKGPALVLWGFAYGSRPGDVMRLTITQPDGTIYLSTEAGIDRQQAQYFRAAGKRIRRGLRPGTYAGTVTLLRDGRPYDSRETSVIVR